jgi:hypothetical protein
MNVAQQQSGRGASKAIKKQSRIISLRKVLLYFSHKEECLGFRVAMFLPSAEDKRTSLAKLKAALDIISRFAPHRIVLMRRQVKWIWVFDTSPYLAEWHGDLQACILDRDYVRSAQVSVEQIAASIIHEATHARLESFGIQYNEQRRSRIERLCAKSELWLAERFPDGKKVAEAAKSKLLMDDSFWTNDAFEDRNLEALRELGKQSWVARLLAKWCQRILAKRRTTEKLDPRPSRE